MPQSNSHYKIKKTHRCPLPLPPSIMPEKDGNDGEILATGYKDEDLVKVIIQALIQKGYSKSAKALSDESGIQLISGEAADFRNSILEGNYDLALEKIADLDRNLERSRLEKIRFEILQVRYLELIEARNIKDALECLRNKLAPLIKGTKEIQKLTSFMVTKEADRTQALPFWFGPGQRSKEALLSRIQMHLSPGILVPEHRLDTLLQHSYNYQLSQCPTHIVSQKSWGFNDSLLWDHQCGEESINFQPARTLIGAQDQVLFIKFSNSGSMIAAGCSNGTIMVWSVPAGDLLHEFQGHSGKVTMLDWTPNDSMLLSCSYDTHARVWDMKSGECIRVFMMNDEISSSLWIDKGRSVLLASLDGVLTKIELDGAEIKRRSIRVIDMSICKGSSIAILDNEGIVHFINGADLTDNVLIQEKGAVLSSVSLDSKGLSMILNYVDSDKMHLWELKGGPQSKRSFNGHKWHNYMIRSCFAREDEGLIVTGSTEGKIYIYHKVSGEIVKVLEEHEECINDVKWMNNHCGILASAGDDHKVILWMRPSIPSPSSTVQVQFN